MTLLTYNNGRAVVSASSNFLLPSSSFTSRPSLPFPLSPFPQDRRTALIARSRKGLASRTRRLEKRGKDRGGATTELDEEASGKGSDARASFIEFSSEVEGEIAYSTGPPPAIPGLEQDFWEGPQWNALGFFIQYMWAFGILFGVVACGVAVATYNEGATDFKQTTVYKESIQSRELLEEPEASDADVFEGNPTEVAPSLE